MRVDSPQTSSSIEAFLRPKSIAIAGASADPGKLGSLPLTFLRKLGYQGALYPINPNVREIDGLSCLPSISAVEQDVDLLVIALAAARIPELLRECKVGQVKSAIVLASGYAELGAEGATLQKELGAQALSKGIRFIGPNSVGLANLWNKNVPTISQVFDQPNLKPGPIAFVSQSGAVGTAVMALAHAEHVKIGYFVSTGNEGDLEFADFCEYFADDPAVSTIAGYLEGVRDGSKFVRAVKRATQAGKPVILLKVGTTDVGERAVRSHTGALAGAEEIYRAAFRDCRVVRAESPEQLVDYLKAFSAFPRISATRGDRPRVVILSHSGGAGVLLADRCNSEGLDVATPSADLAKRLGQRLPSYASLQNPIDMTANVIFDPALITATVSETINSGEYDATILCVNLMWRQGDSLADHLLHAARGSANLPAVAWIAGKRDPIDRLNAGGVPVFTDPVRCAEAVSRILLWHSARKMDGPTESDFVSIAPAMKPQLLRTHEGQENLFDIYSIPRAPSALVQDFAGARRAAHDLGYPVAAKIVASELAHKSEIGGVFVDLASDADLRRAYDTLERIAVPRKQGILIQKMVRGIYELFAGTKRDEVFGPVVVFGLGGIYVEILRASVLRLAPFSEEQAKRFMREAKFFPILAGARGKSPIDIDAVARILSRLSVLATEQPEVKSIDLNPIMTTRDSAVVVDAKIGLG
jgi:acetate---CoA ligase (ADP-forming)